MTNIYVKPRADCPYCEKDHAVCKDKTFHIHGPVKNRCDGSNMRVGVFRRNFYRIKEWMS